MATTIPFTDGLMLRYLQPGNVEALLSPSTDPERTRLRSLLVSVYDPDLLDIRTVESVKVDHKEFQTAVHATLAVHGSWDKSIPSTEQARATVEIPATPPVHWIDMSLDTMVSVRTAPAGATLAAVDADPWAATDGAGARPGEFERPYRLQYADPPPFDPTAPARNLALRVSTLFFDRLDLADALRRLSEAKRAVDAASPQSEVHDGGTRLASSAWLAVFPALTPDDPSQTTEQLVGDLLATQGFVAAFEAAP
ncbi:hypothetical protein [Streptomyces venezuelae]|uniref:hypothetical protein n=1 Tax=Streptomyces venezuelae TaxID=54571 RepID=UPI00278BB40C|nr:hypothetical protein [Streptomyces venezuelae]